MKAVLRNVFRHYKGDLYELITLAKAEVSGELLVVYRGVGKEEVWVRPFNEWELKFEQEPLLLIPETEVPND